MAEEQVQVEEYEICGEVAVSEVREMLGRDDIRRITLKNEDGDTILEVPMLTAASGGVSSAVLLPVWAGIGAAAALSPRLRICVQRIGPTHTHAKP